MSDLNNSYESVIILSLRAGEDAVTALVQKFKDLISSHAVLDSVDEWGKKRFAYAINKETDGYYVLFNFTSGPEFPSELERICRITDGVLRSLVIKKEQEAENSKAKEKTEEKENKKETEK
jgi:small subunit ribosomal protein S6